MLHKRFMCYTNLKSLNEKLIKARTRRERDVFIEILLVNHFKEKITTRKTVRFDRLV